MRTHCPFSTDVELIYNKLFCYLCLNFCRLLTYSIGVSVPICCYLYVLEILVQTIEFHNTK